MKTEIKTAEQVITQYYPFDNATIKAKDISINGDYVVKYMEEYADQFKPKWISVDDEKPFEGQLVLVVIKFSHLKERLVHPVRYSMSKFHFIDGNTLVSSQHKITHWMPLPIPPKQ